MNPAEIGIDDKGAVDGGARARGSAVVPEKGRVVFDNIISGSLRDGGETEQNTEEKKDGEHFDWNHNSDLARWWDQGQTMVTSLGIYIDIYLHTSNISLTARSRTFVIDICIEGLSSRLPCSVGQGTLRDVAAFDNAGKIY